MVLSLLHQHCFIRFNNHCYVLVQKNNGSKWIYNHGFIHINNHGYILLIVSGEFTIVLVLVFIYSANVYIY